MAGPSGGEGEAPPQSGAPERPGDDHEPGPSSAKRMQELSLCPHDGYVVLDLLPCGETMVTHVVTLERFRLARHRWHIEFDQEGFAAIYERNEDGDMGAEIVVEDKLQFELYTSEAGELVLTHKQDPNQIMALNRFMQKWTSATLKLPVGNIQALLSLECAVFKWARGGAKVAVSAKALYQALSLNQFNGKQWRWVAGSWKRWQKHMTSMGMGEHIMATGSMEAPIVSHETHLVPLHVRPEKCLQKMWPLGLRSHRHAIVPPPAFPKPGWASNGATCIHVRGRSPRRTRRMPTCRS